MAEQYEDKMHGSVQSDNLSKREKTITDAENSGAHTTPMHVDQVQVSSHGGNLIHPGGLASLFFLSNDSGYCVCASFWSLSRGYLVAAST